MTQPKNPRSPADGISQTVHRNLEALLEFRQRIEQEKSIHERVADAVAGYAGSMGFVYVHAVVVAFWVGWNAVPGVPAWDPYPFTVLAVAASVEAIFLTSMVLVSQNRLARVADRRADLDLQISLLAEREITRLMALTSAVARRLGVEAPADISEFQRDVDPKEILDRIERSEQGSPHQTPPSQRRPEGSGGGEMSQA